jgi:hypothetical protein
LRLPLVACTDEEARRIIEIVEKWLQHTGFC